MVHWYCFIVLLSYLDMIGCYIYTIFFWICFRVSLLHYHISYNNHVDSMGLVPCHVRIPPRSQPVGCGSKAKVVELSGDETEHPTVLSCSACFQCQHWMFTRLLVVGWHEPESVEVRSLCGGEHCGWQSFARPASLERPVPSRSIGESGGLVDEVFMFFGKEKPVCWSTGEISWENCYSSKVQRSKDFPSLS